MSEWERGRGGRRLGQSLKVSLASEGPSGRVAILIKVQVVPKRASSATVLRKRSGLRLT